MCSVWFAPESRANRITGPERPLWRSTSRLPTICSEPRHAEDGETATARTLGLKTKSRLSPSLSPDGRRLAIEVREGLDEDIWAYDFGREAMTRITFDGKANRGPIWSFDGRHIVFRGADGLSWTRADGASKPQLLIRTKTIVVPWSFTPNGKRLAYSEVDDPKTGYDLWTVPVENDGTGLRAGKPEVFLQTPADERHPSFSPDGKWLAYASTESGGFQERREHPIGDRCPAAEATSAPPTGSGREPPTFARPPE
jgi:Tol biopolymer transport system component